MRLIFFIGYQTRITIITITITIFLIMEELYLSKIGPNFIGWSVIRGNNYEKTLFQLQSTKFGMENSVIKIDLYDPLVLQGVSWQSE